MGGRKQRWKHPKNKRRLNFEAGIFDSLPVLNPATDKEFEDLTVSELRSSVAYFKQIQGSWESHGLDVTASEESAKLGRTCGSNIDWLDKDLSLNLFEWGVESSEAKDMLNLVWKPDDDWQCKKWIKFDSVVKSGAACPVAPPTMAPNVPIGPSEGSKRGQRWTSASKHKLKNLGQQRIKACAEEGNFTDVMFQVAEVGKPIISVSALCEKGHRVLFGRGGGIVRNMSTGVDTPFYRKNGVYVMSFWMLDEAEPDPSSTPSTSSFGRPRWQ